MTKRILFVLSIIAVLGLIPNLKADGLVPPLPTGGGTGTTGTTTTSEIYYTLTDLGGGSWEYSYTIAPSLVTVGSRGTGQTGALFEFDIYFPASSSPDAFSYSNLTEVANPDPTTWTPTIISPSEPGDLTAIYIEDASLSSPGIASGQSLGGFSVTFDYSGTATLGSQSFEFYDPTDYGEGAIYSGMSVPVPVTVPTPEPSSFMLLVSVASLLFGIRRWARS